MTDAVLVLAWLVFAHLLADFVLQNDWIAGNKVEYVRTAGGSVRIFVDTLWREPARSADMERKEVS